MAAELEACEEIRAEIDEVFCGFFVTTFLDDDAVLEPLLVVACLSLVPFIFSGCFLSPIGAVGAANRCLVVKAGIGDVIAAVVVIVEVG